MTTNGWKIERRYAANRMTFREVFIAPDGTEYVRATEKTTEVILPTKSGIPIRLKKRSRPFGGIQEGDAKIIADIHRHWKE
jgi:hypothetical protein